MVVIKQPSILLVYSEIIPTIMGGSTYTLVDVVTNIYYIDN